MSLREKAVAIKAAGEAERGNFTPSGTPLKMYKYWARNSRSSKVPARENFCHFWRVVLLWAPLKFLVNKAVDAIDYLVFRGAFWLAILALYVVFSLGTVVFGNSILGLTLLGIPYVISGIGSGLSLEFTEEDDWEGNEKQWATWISYFTFPVSLPVRAIGRSLNWAYDHWNSKWNRWFANVAKVLVVLIGASALIGGFIAGVLDGGWVFVMAVTLALVFVAIIVVAFSFLSDMINGRRKLREERAFEKSRTYVASEDTSEPKAEKKKSLVGKFFSGVGDFIILIVQVVRVKKWKICPLVDINDTH